MSIARFSRALIAAISSGTVGVFDSIVSLNNIKYGTLGEVPGAPGISSANPRGTRQDTIVSQAIAWRGADTLKPELSNVGAVQTSLDRGQSFDFEWTPKYDGTPASNTESIIGSLPQVDVTYGIAQAGTPTTTDHGMLVDSVVTTGQIQAGLAAGWSQVVIPGGAALNTRRFTLTVYCAHPNPTLKTGNVYPGARLSIQGLDNGGAWVESYNTSAVQVAGGNNLGTYFRATLANVTFISASVTQIRVIVGFRPNGLAALTPAVLVAAAQLEENTSATPYERTSNTARGVKNFLLGSHFPTRAPWVVYAPTNTGAVTTAANAGRGPEVRAIVPTPGTIEFGMATTGLAVGNGLVQFLPYDAYGQIGGRITFTGTPGDNSVSQFIVDATAPGNTYIVSAFVRLGTQGNGAFYLNISGNTSGGAYVSNSSVLFPAGTAKKAWRRVWWSWTVPTGAPFNTIGKIYGFVGVTTFTSGDNIEVTGLMLEKVAGAITSPPSEYERTGASPGTVNKIAYSEDPTQWGKSNSAGATITTAAYTGYGPIEYYDVSHPDYGVIATRLRINRSPGLSGDWDPSPSTLLVKDDFTGEAYSIGSYGVEQVGTGGDFAWASSAPTGWTIDPAGTAAAAGFFETDGAPNAWIDDEEGLTPQGVRHTPDLTVSPTKFLSRAFTLAAGWNTIRLRVARVQVSGYNQPVVISLRQGNFSGPFMGYDRVSFPDTTRRWLQIGRDQGTNSPDFGVCVWHVYLPSAGTYTISIGCQVNSSVKDVLFDQLRIWSDAGQLYSSTDRTETSGVNSFLIQGFDVLFRGVIDGATSADDTTLKIRCLDYIHGTLQQIPKWTTQPNCQVKFRGKECGYVSQKQLATSISPAFPAGTVLAIAYDGTTAVLKHTLSAGTTDSLQVGRYILGSDGVTPTLILAILSATQFSTQQAQTYAAGTPVVYADCKHTYPDCYLRSRTHGFSGFRATQALIAQGGSPLWSDTLAPGHMNGFAWMGPTQQLASTAQLMGALSITGQQSLYDKRVFDDSTIPVVYGRKSVKGIPIETHATMFVADGSEWLTTFYAISMGEIYDVRGFFTADSPIVHDPQNGIGIYWHPGRQGEDAWWLLADQFGSGAPVYTTYKPWAVGTYYVANAVVLNDSGKIYTCVTPGTSLSTGAGPSGTGAGIGDGSVVWNYTGIAGPAGYQKINNQRRDFRTNTDNAYNRVAYAVVQIRKGAAHADLNDPTNIIDITCDVKGRLVQVYDKNGVPVGSPAWSRNPIWIAIDALLDGVFGPALPPSLINWVQMAESAAICDVPIASVVAVSQIRTTYPSWAQNTTYSTGNIVVNDSGKLYVCFTPGTSLNSGTGPAGIADDITDNNVHWRYYNTFVSSTWGVTSIDGFAPEMNTTVAGVARVVKFVDPINLRITWDSAFTPTTGDVVLGFPARFTCDINLSDKSDLATFMDIVMSSCRGILTFDGGKIGILIDKSATTDATAFVWGIQNPTPLSTMLGVIPDGVESNPPTNDNSYNALEITYDDAQLVAGTGRVLKFYDADRGGLDFPRVAKLQATGCDTPEQALRAMLPRFAKMISAPGGKDTFVDDRGLKITTGIRGLQMQIGDFVVLTRPTRVTSQKSRIRALTVNPDLTVTIETAPEARTIRPEGFTAPFDVYTDLPLLGTASASPLPLCSLYLRAEQTTANQLHAAVTVAGYGLAPGSGAGLNAQKFVQMQLHVSTVKGFVPVFGRPGFDGTMVAADYSGSGKFIWNVPRASQEIQLYIKAIGLEGGISDNAFLVISNEIPIVIYHLDRPTSDPTQQEGSSSVNMVYDGDFRVPANWKTDAAAVSYPGIDGLGPDNVTPGVYVPVGASGIVTPVATDPAPPAYTQTLAVMLDETVGPTTVVVGKITDTPNATGDATYAKGLATFGRTLGGVRTCTTPGFLIKNFGSGTHNARPFFRASALQANLWDIGSLSFYYSLDGTTAWTPFTVTGGPIGATLGDVYGPVLTGINYATFAMIVLIRASEVTLIHGDPHFGAYPLYNQYAAKIIKAGLEEETASTYGGYLTVAASKADVGVIHSDGTYYGNLRRAFPGRLPIPGQPAFTLTTLNHFRIKLRKHIASDMLDDSGVATNGVEVRIYDAANPTNSWSLGIIPPGEISSDWIDFAVKFSPSTTIIGDDLQIEVRTLNTKSIEIDHLGVWRGDTLWAWMPSAEELGNGFHGNFASGHSTAFGKGSWAPGGRKKSPVA